MAKVNLKVPRPEVGWPAFLIRVALYLAITVFAAMVLFTGFRLPIDLEFAEVGVIPAFVYLGIIAVLGFIIQRQMARAYGAKRTVDKLISLPMLIIVILAVLVWFGVDVVVENIGKVVSWFGYQLQTVPTEYMKEAAAIFGAAAILDFILDRLASRYRSASVLLPGGQNTAATGPAIIAGEVNQPPHTPIHLESESGNPFFHTEGNLLVKIPDHAYVQLPNGRTFVMPITERLADRMEWNFTRAALPAPANPGGEADAAAAPADANAGGDAGGNGGGNGN